VVLIRTLHIVAVLAACVLMFRPAANAYFRGAGQMVGPHRGND
jgi:hypothetical protein